MRRSPTYPWLFDLLAPEEVYLLGLIWSDGHLHIYNRPRGGCRITYTTTDLELAEHASGISGAPIRASARPAGWSTAYRLSIGGEPVMDRAVALGLTRKPDRTTPAVPHPRHFIRGYFDGDGSVSLRPSGPHLRLTAKFCGPRAVLEGIQHILGQGTSIQPRKLIRNGNGWVLAFNHADCLRLNEHLYTEGGPRLTRKRDVFVEGAAVPFPLTKMRAA